MKRMVSRRQKAQAWGITIPGRIYAKMMKNLQIGSGNPESYLATYSGLIHPILDKASWLRADGDGILPPEASLKSKEE
ncbi:hypothetical protein WN943_001186 [Citrus x changshan-huyou]